MKYCPYCDAGLDADMRFCPKCGKPFEGGKENPHTTAKHLKPESPAYDYAPVSKQTKKKKRGGIIALVIVAVLIAVGVGLYFSGVFAPKEEPKLPFSDDTAAIAQASNSVVMLNCYDKDGELFATGSGFAAFDDGIIVTNYHVIEQNVYRVTAQTESGASFECPTIIAYDADKDIAILKADRKTGLMLLAPGKTDGLQKGEKVVAIGSPLGLINSVSTGVFSGYTDDDEVGRALQFTAAVSHGSSGGALFNNAGEVIGITFASLSDGQNLNLAIPVDEAVRLFESSSVSNPQSMSDFYDSFKHVPDIPAYTVDYVCNHYEELNGKTITVSGYICFIEQEQNKIYLMNTPDEACTPDNSDLDKWVRVMFQGISSRGEAIVIQYDDSYSEMLFSKWNNKTEIILTGSFIVHNQGEDGFFSKTDIVVDQ